MRSSSAAAKKCERHSGNGRVTGRSPAARRGSHVSLWRPWPMHAPRGTSLPRVPPKRAGDTDTARHATKSVQYPMKQEGRGVFGCWCGVGHTHVARTCAVRCCVPHAAALARSLPFISRRVACARHVGGPGVSAAPRIVHHTPVGPSGPRRRVACRGTVLYGECAAHCTARSRPCGPLAV